MVPSHRRQGLGLLLAAALIAWCLDRGLEPHWDAANPESRLLAEKLGYDTPTEYESLYVGN